jgi:hypothetical protein
MLDLSQREPLLIKTVGAENGKWKMSRGSGVKWDIERSMQQGRKW